MILHYFLSYSFYGFLDYFSIFFSLTRFTFPMWLWTQGYSCVSFPSNIPIFYSSSNAYGIVSNFVYRTYYRDFICPILFHHVQFTHKHIDTQLHLFFLSNHSRNASFSAVSSAFRQLIQCFCSCHYFPVDYLAITWINVTRLLCCVFRCCFTCLFHHQ